MRSDTVPIARLQQPDADLEDHWDQLAELCRSAPFARPGWIRAWSAANKAEVTALTLRRDGAPIAIIPLMRGVAGTLHTPGDWHTPLFEIVGADRGAIEGAAAALARLGSPRITVDFVDRLGLTAQVLEGALSDAGYEVTVRPRQNSPFIALTGDWETYQETLPSRLLRDLRRRQRRLTEHGELSFEVHRETARLGALLEEGFAVEGAGWKGAEGTAIGSDTRTLRLYADSARWAAGRGWLRLAFLRLDGRAIAFDYCIEAGGRHYLLKTGYDPEFRNFAPGKLLRLEMIRRAFRESLTTYEFAGGDDAWKREWTTATREIVTLEARAPTITGRALSSAARIWRAARRLKRRMS